VNKALGTVLYMVILTAVFTGAVTVVGEATKDRIAVNESLTERRKILLALGVTEDERLSAGEVEQVFRNNIREMPWKGHERAVYGRLNERGVAEAYAFPIEGPGFWGPIYGYLGVSADGAEIIGLVFIRHSETPGLGARIEELWFRKQFQGKSIKPSGGTSALSFVAQGRELDERSVHAITGATQTSRALERFLDEDLKEIHRAFEQGGLSLGEGVR